MIGGRIFDVTAIVNFATARLVYSEALAMTAIEENIVARPCYAPKHPRLTSRDICLTLVT